MIITSVKPKSAAEKKGIKKGDVIVSMGGNPVRDLLDYYLYASVLPLEMVIRRGKKEFSVEFTTYPELMKLGIEVEDLKIKHCGNKCVFCFVDQNPKHLRKTLYIKDEDYRYSYLYGSFCTLSNISQRELDRIVEQNLSPLYISVHALDLNTRLKLLGLKKDDRFIDKLTFLTDHGIQLHTQIVMCPGINDGKIMVETIEKLYTYFPGVLSVAVVPLGKTQFRDKLAPLRSVTKEDAIQVISTIERLQKKYLRRSGTRFVFAADEFYLKSGSSIPNNAGYEEYQQYENGVGMIRYFLQVFGKAKKLYPAKVTKPLTVLIVTGKSFFPVVKRNVLPALNRIENMHAHAITADNHLLGDEITVSGLLCGRDMIRAVKESGVSADMIIIPDTALNTNGVTLDDMTMSEIAKELKVRVITSDNLISSSGMMTK